MMSRVRSLSFELNPQRRRRRHGLAAPLRLPPDESDGPGAGGDEAHHLDAGDPLDDGLGHGVLELAGRAEGRTLLDGGLDDDVRRLARGGLALRDRARLVGEHRA